MRANSRAEYLFIRASCEAVAPERYPAPEYRTLSAGVRSLTEYAESRSDYEAAKTAYRQGMAAAYGDMARKLDAAWSGREYKTEEDTNATRED
ncbi:hypothetical protein [Paenibacillus sp. P22]|uniref:hypothetical protein n=1 Tax=Paenibacillus sp. P22 TaxID=483908 RepID=UPI00038F4424|nr:hypothetical protein [Paenibacillus sp. P22]CDN42021.1 hypothetical protein BN871_AT_00230 [Paenibacillus sp. P22]